MGHTVLAVPVPALEAVVRERTAFYDASFVSADPGFAHAHITVLGPWVPEPTIEDLATVAEISADTTCFDVKLERVEEFPNGLLHLPPVPDDELRALTARLAAAFPEHPPYGGAFGDVAPHLTLDQRSATVTRESVRERVAHLLPAAVTVDRIDLQWWANDDCRLLQSFPLRPRANDR
ncbi:2'-5' RNA ligase family protein [Flexivirga sp. B27]